MKLNGVVALAILALALAAVPPPAHAAADARERISFDDALAIALKHNRPLRAAELASRAAQYGVSEARGAMIPRLDALEAYTNTNNPTLVFSNLLNQQDFTPNDFHLDRLNYPPSFANFQSQVRLSQTIFAGGRLWAALEASRDRAATARWRALRRRQETVFAVVQAYYGAVLAEERVTVLERALSAARSHAAQAEHLFAHGMVVKADALRAAVMAGAIEQERNRARNDLLNGWAILAHTLGAENRPLAPLKKPPEVGAARAAPPATLEALIASTVRTRPEIKAAQAEVDLAAQMVRMAEADYLPSLGVAAAYENDSKALARAGNNYSVFVTGQLNLFNGGATAARIDAAEAERARARELKDELVHGVAVEVETAYHALAAARENLGVARKDEAAASEAASMIENRYGSGLATNVEALDAETAMREAALGLAEATVVVLVDRAALSLAAGELDFGKRP